MDYQSVKQDFLNLNKKTLKMVSSARSIPGINEEYLASWENTGNEINKQINEDIIRVAVVGTIKSGKSTFINSFLNGDYLKRGPGVVTSIVTRIQTGPDLSASLDLKTWDQVNSDIRGAMVLLPSIQLDENGFDIRKDEDRKKLEQALVNLNFEQMISQDALDLNGLLLKSYLSGYDEVAHLISSVPVKKEFINNDFEKHKNFVGNQSLAVYLNDIKLQIINNNPIMENLELADCQGSDSPNPMHIAMIQDYLLKTHFIIYVVSTRTGLRQADIKFLNMIKSMGIIENILFVLNCDISEHESIEDLQNLLKVLTDELSLIKQNPDIFVFSSLYKLFETREHLLSKKDSYRLKQWQEDEEISKLSIAENKRFNEELISRLIDKRYAILLKNNLERINIVVSSIYGLCNVNLNLLDKGKKGAEEIMARMDSMQKAMEQLSQVSKKTLSGGFQEIKTQLGREVDSFFDSSYGDVAKSVLNFVKNYTISSEKYETLLEEKKLPIILYKVFQNFKSELDEYMTEIINPRIISFIKTQEEKIVEYLNTVEKSYDSMMNESIENYCNYAKELGVDFNKTLIKTSQPVEIDLIKKSLNIEIPTLRTSIQYNQKIKSEAMMTYGVFSIFKLFKSLFKKPVEKTENTVKALKRSVKALKKETARSLIDHFMDFRENLKFQYFYKLIEMVSENIFENIIERYQIFNNDMTRVADIFYNDKEEKNRVKDMLQLLAPESREILIEIEKLKNKLLMKQV